MRYVTLALILVLPLCVIACSSKEEPTPPTPAPPPPAPVPPPSPGWTYFEIGFPTLAEGRFVIALNDPAKIEQARKAISDPEQNPHSVMGIIAKSAAGYNPPWSYHLDPATIEFFEFAIEVCDAAPQYVEDHLAEACGAFLPDCRWCPWSSKVLAEVPDASTESGS